MKNGRLGVAATVANTNVLTYTATSGIKVAIVNIRCMNPNSNDATIQIAITKDATTTPTAADLIEAGPIKADGGVIERNGVSVSAGETVWVLCTLAGVTVRVDGFERA